MQGIVAERVVVQAVDPYLPEPTTTLFVTFGGHRLNLAEAVKVQPHRATRRLRAMESEAHAPTRAHGDPASDADEGMSTIFDAHTLGIHAHAGLVDKSGQPSTFRQASYYSPFRNVEASSAL